MQHETHLKSEKKKKKIIQIFLSCSLDLLYFHICLYFNHLRSYRTRAAAPESAPSTAVSGLLAAGKTRVCSDVDVSLTSSCCASFGFFRLGSLDAVIAPPAQPQSSGSAGVTAPTCPRVNLAAGAASCPEARPETRLLPLPFKIKVASQA